MIAFRSLEAYVKMAVTGRFNMIGAMHAYPSANGTMSRLVKLLDFDSMTGLITSVLHSRNIGKAAANTLRGITVMQAHKYQFDAVAIRSHIVENADNLGLIDPNDTDIDLITNLIVSAESTDYTWMLHMPTDENKNILVKISKLYKEIENMSVSVAEDLSDISSSFSVYSSGSDNIIDYHFSATVQDLFEKAKSDTVRGKDKIKNRTSFDVVTAKVAYIRFLDHIVDLIMSPEKWHLFITERTGAATSDNIDRIAGFNLMAGYFHSLLLMHTFYRIEFFKQGYEYFNTAYNLTIAIPEETNSDYKEFVSKSDALSVSQDVADILSNMLVKTRDEMTTVSIIPSEFLSFNGLKVQIDKIENSLKPITTLDAFTDLKILKKSEFVTLLSCYPVATMMLKESAIAILLDRETYKAVINEGVSGIIHLAPRYLQPSNIVEEIRRKIGVVSMQFSMPLPIEYDAIHVSPLTLASGEFNHKYQTLPDRLATQVFLRRVLSLHVFPERQFIVNNMTDYTTADTGVATILRGWTDRNWDSLYPANLVPGTATACYIPTLVKDILQLYAWIEKLTGVNIDLFKALLENENFITAVATYFSSWAMIYRRDPQKDQPNLLMPVHGLGTPYGMSYDSLAAKNKFKKDDLIAINDNFYICILKVYPTPQDKLSIETFSYQYPYYYCQASKDFKVVYSTDYDSEILRVIKDDSDISYADAVYADLNVNETIVSGWLVCAPGLLNFALRPVTPINDVPVLLFDRLRAFRNDSLILQDDMNHINIHPANKASYVFNPNLGEIPWDRDKIALHLKFIKPKTLLTVTASAPTGQAPVSDLTKVISDLETTQKAVRADENLAAKVTAVSPDTAAGLESIAKKDGTPPEIIDGSASDSTVGIKEKKKK